MSSEMKPGSIRTLAGEVFPCRYSLAFAQDRVVVQTFGATEIVAGLHQAKGSLFCPGLTGILEDGFPTLIMENDVEIEIDAELDAKGQGTFKAASQARPPVTQ